MGGVNVPRFHFSGSDLRSPADDPQLRFCALATSLRSVEVDGRGLKYFAEGFFVLEVCLKIRGGTSFPLSASFVVS